LELLRANGIDKMSDSCGAAIQSSLTRVLLFALASGLERPGQIQPTLRVENDPIEKLGRRRMLQSAEESVF
jgi:hypothetical protein